VKHETEYKPTPTPTPTMNFVRNGKAVHAVAAAVDARRVRNFGRRQGATTSVRKQNVSSAAANRSYSTTAGAVVADKNVEENGVTAMPQPIVIINNEVDPIATVVTIKFGDYLGDLLDTVAALKNLNLNIVRAKFDMEGNKNKFFITDEKNGEKIFSSERLEEIRMTIINNLMLYHPESLDELSSFFHAKRAAEPLSKLGARGAPSVNTEVSLYRDQQDIRTILEITTADRPGLLVDIVKTLKDVSVNVISAKVETIGKAAHDVFAVTYHGEALNGPMETLVANALYYYLARAEVEKEESY